MSASPINYSKWNKIEISDDEDDTHPNVDTPSLFRMRHQARLERMAERKTKKDKIEKNLSECQRNVVQAQSSEGSSTEKSQELQKQIERLQKKQEKLEEEERKEPWNIDTICKTGFDQSRINKVKSPEPKIEDLAEEEKDREATDFSSKNHSLIKKFAMLRKFQDSQHFLVQNPELCCEYMADSLLAYCLQLEIDQKHSLMEHVAHQTVLIQYLLELAKEIEYNPKSSALISILVSKLKKKNAYREMFDEDVVNLRKRVSERAAAKQQEMAETERQKRLGPGGLDPQEVFQCLPEEMQECFREQDLEKLERVSAVMDSDQFEYHLKRCVDSGLWVPGKKNGGPYAQNEE